MMHATLTKHVVYSEPPQIREGANDRLIVTLVKGNDFPNASIEFSLYGTRHEILEYLYWVTDHVIEHEDAATEIPTVII